MDQINVLCRLHILVSLWQDTVQGCVFSKQNPETRTRLASVKVGGKDGGWLTQLQVAEQ